MAETSIRDTLIAMLRQERQIEREVAASLSEEARNAERLIDTWGLKHIITHISSAKFGIAGDLAAGRQGQDVVPFNADEHFSERIYAQYQHATWEEVTAYADASVDTLIAEAEQYDDARLQERTPQPWMPDGATVAGFIFGFGVNHPYEHIAQVYAENGHPDTAYALLESMIPLHRALDAPPYEVAISHYDLARAFTTLGRKDFALAHLRDALQGGAFLREWLAEDPTFDPLRDDAEFQAL